MTDETLVEETAERLRMAIVNNLFEAGDAALAKQCLSRLQGKVRVSVMGPRPDDATDLVNFLVGADLLPRKKGNCPVRVDQGSRTSAIATFRDETTRVFEADALAEAFEGSPRFVRVRSDQKAMTRISVVRASASSAFGLRQMAQFAEAMTDVCLWVTDDLSDQEINVWTQLPERLQHHAFLVIAPGHENNAEIRARSEGLFADVIELDPLAASAARAAPSGVDKTAFKAAGGTDMVRLIKREIDLINRAALDAAQVLLMRLLQETVTPVVAAAPEKKNPAMTPAAEKPAPVKLVEPQSLDAAPARSARPVTAKPEPLARIMRPDTPTPEAEALRTTARPRPETAPEPAAEDVVHELGMSVRLRKTRPVRHIMPDDLGLEPEAGTDADPSAPASHSFTRPRTRSRVRSSPSPRPATPWSLNLS
jgi:hypothetical protein